MDNILKKNPVHDNKLKKFWLQDSYFDILKNDKCDDDIDILNIKDNNQYLILKRETFIIII